MKDVRLDGYLAAGSIGLINLFAGIVSMWEHSDSPEFKNRPARQKVN